MENYGLHEKDRVVEKDSESEVENRQQSCVERMPEVAEGTIVAKFASAYLRWQRADAPED